MTYLVMKRFVSLMTSVIIKYMLTEFRTRLKKTYLLINKLNKHFTYLPFTNYINLKKNR